MHLPDQEIINGLIARDNRVTEEFFFVKCRPLFCNVIKKVFKHDVDYDEFVNELYVYLMADDAVKLRHFEYRSSVYQWLKVVAIRYFINKRDRMIDPESQEALYNRSKLSAVDEKDEMARYDLERLFSKMPNKRYVSVIRSLVIEECKPEDLALEMHVTTANLYNIKRRAMAQLTHVAINDIKKYGK